MSCSEADCCSAGAVGRRDQGAAGCQTRALDPPWFPLLRQVGLQCMQGQQRQGGALQVLPAGKGGSALTAWSVARSLFQREGALPQRQTLSCARVTRTRPGLPACLLLSMSAAGQGPLSHSRCRTAGAGWNANRAPPRPGLLGRVAAEVLAARGRPARVCRRQCGARGAARRGRGDQLGDVRGGQAAPGARLGQLCVQGAPQRSLVGVIRGCMSTMLVLPFCLVASA